MLFGISMIANATTFRERFEFVDFFPLVLVIPAAALFLRARIWQGPLILSTLALFGTVAAVTVCIVRGLIGGFGRTGAWELSPIYFADMAMIAGFMALAGQMSSTARWRWLYWLGPVLGLVASILAGTRGALLVGASLIPVALFYLWRGRRPGCAALLAVVACVVLLVAITALAAVVGLGRTFQATSVLQELLTGKRVSDLSVFFRLDMYQAAFRAIPSEPFFGYGWSHQFEHILPFMSPAGQDEYQREHWGYVHNEILSLVIGMGVLGVVGAVLLFAAPFMESRDNSERR